MANTNTMHTVKDGAAIHPELASPRTLLSDLTQEQLPQQTRIDFGNTLNQPDLTFADCSKVWLQAKKIQVKESSYQKYENNLDLYLLPTFGLMQLKAIDNQKVQDFISYLIDPCKLCVTTIRNLINQFNSILQFGSALMAQSLPELIIICPRQQAKPLRVLSPSEQSKLERTLESQTNLTGFGILFALYTGVRIGELCALRWEDIDLEDETVHVHKTLQRLRADDGPSKTIVKVTQPKSVGSDRIIPLTKRLVKLCKKHQAGADCYILSGNKHYVEPRTLQARFAKIANQLGLKGAHFHTLRHTFATRSIEVGFDIKCLSEILGHSSVKITLDRYVHPTLALKRANMAKLKSVESNATRRPKEKVGSDPNNVTLKSPLGV